MKKLTFLLLLLPALSFSQTNKYGFVTAGVHLIGNDTKAGGAVTIGVMPKGWMGVGLSLDYINDYGTPLLGDFRFISRGNNGAKLTAAAKVGYFFDSRDNITGKLAIGGEAGIIIGRKPQAIIITIKYLSLGYDKLDPNNGNAIGKASFNDFAISAGFKFW